MEKESWLVLPDRSGSLWQVHPVTGIRADFFEILMFTEDQLRQPHGQNNY